VFQGVRVGRVGQQQLAHLAHVEQAVAIAPLTGRLRRPGLGDRPATAGRTP
jgi:hypothetical protein